MHRGPVVGCGVRKYFPDVAGSESDPDAVTDSDTDSDAHADANPDADANPNPDANPNTESGRVHHIHHRHTESGAVDWRRRRGL